MIQSLFSVVLGEFSRLERSSFYKALLSYYMRDNALCLVRISFLQNFNQPCWSLALVFRFYYILSPFGYSFKLLEGVLPRLRWQPCKHAPHSTSASKSLSIGFILITSYRLLALKYCMRICMICCMILCFQLLVITYCKA